MNSGDIHDIEVIYPSLSQTNDEEMSWSSTTAPRIGIIEHDYCDWDVVLHELGHQVSRHINVNTDFTGTHFINENLSEKNGKELGIKGAWSEGFATYFSIASQLYYNRNVETISRIPNVADKLYTNLRFDENIINYESNHTDYTIYEGHTDGNEAAVTAVMLNLLWDKNINLTDQQIWNIVKNGYL